MTIAKTIQHLAALTVGLFTMLGAVMLALIPDLTNVIRASTFVISGAVVMHMLTRPDPPMPSAEAIFDALLTEHPMLAADPVWASQLAATAHGAVRSQGRR